MSSSSIDALVQEKTKKYDFLFQVIKENAGAEIEHATSDFDILLASQLLPVLTEGMEKLGEQIEKFINDPKVQIGNVDPERDALDKYAINMGVKEIPRHIPPRVRERFNPLRWLAAYIMRNHPSYAPPAISKKEVSDRLFFDTLAAYCDVERGRRELTRLRPSILKHFKGVRSAHGGMFGLCQMEEALVGLDRKLGMQDILARCFIFEVDSNGRPIPPEGGDDACSSHEERAFLNMVLKDLASQQLAKRASFLKQGDASQAAAVRVGFDPEMLTEEEYTQLWDAAVLAAPKLPSWAEFEDGRIVQAQNDEAKAKEADRKKRVKDEEAMIAARLVEMKHHHATLVQEASVNPKWRSTLEGDTLSLEAGKHLELVRDALDLYDLDFAAGSTRRSPWRQEDATGLRELQLALGIVPADGLPSGPTLRALLDSDMFNRHVEEWGRITREEAAYV